MKLGSLELESFQAHGALRVELAPSITSITGPTDVGKSSVLRALRWLCLNDLPGSSFVRDGADAASVTLHAEDGHTVTRSRSTSGANTYVLDGKAFKSFGQSVPGPVADLLQLNEINFQGQHDSPFWFNETAGEVSRRLNAVIDLGLIDTALSNVASEVRRAQERRSVCEERIAELRRLHAEAKAGKDRVRDFKSLRRLREQAAAARDGADRLSALLSRLEELQSVPAPPNFASVAAAWKRCEAARQNAHDLRTLIERIEAGKKRTAEKIEAARDAEERFHDLVEGEACPLCGKPL